MIEFDNFVFSTPFFTGGEWFLSAARVVQLPYRYIGPLTFPSPDTNTKFVVSLVRHPYLWLKEFYFSERKGNATLGLISEYSELSKLAREEEFLSGFINRFIRKKDQIWDVFAVHKASTCLRTSDLPWAAIEFFQSVGVDESQTSALRGFWYREEECPMFLSVEEESKLKQAVADAEPRFCESYGYIGWV